MARSAKRLLALLAKEMIQLWRDRTTLGIVLAVPFIELFLFAYAIDMTVDHIPTAVADLSHDQESVALVQALENSNFFDVTLWVEDETAVIRAIDEGKVRAGVVIPPDMAAQMERGDAQALVLLDGSDSFTVQSGYAAAVAVTQDRAMELLVDKVERSGGDAAELVRAPLEATTHILYNPTIDDMVFIVPSMAALLLQLLTVNLTALAVVRERELGTIEQLLITPIRPVELMIAKMLPNVLVAAIGMACVTLLGIYWFGVPFRGNGWLFAWLSLLFLLSGLGLGLLISTISQSQKQAQSISTLFLMLSLLLTGFIYPRAPMPPLVKAAGNLIPLTYFVRIVRGIFTKGIGLEFLTEDVIALVVYGSLVMVFAALSFRKRLD